MPRVTPHQRLMPSLLDRLIDPDSEGGDEGEGYGVEQMIEVVRRDMEDLLNTRQTTIDIPEAYTEVLESIVAYGLPDLTALTAISMGERRDVGEAIAGVITRFEPRLRDVRVSIAEGHDGADRTAQFHVEARLNVDPSPEVGFETFVELTSGHASIKRKDV